MGLFLFNSRLLKARKASILAFIFVLSSLVSLVIPVTAFAAQKVSTMDPANAATAFVYYKALRKCLDEGALTNYHGTANWNSMSADNAVTYEWFYSLAGFSTWGGLNSTDVGVYGDTRTASNGGDGRYTCYQDGQGKAFLRQLVNLTGYSSGPEFLCAIGFSRESNKSDCTGIIDGAKNDFIAPNDKAGALDKWWLSTIGATNAGPSGIGAGEYVLYYESFLKACGVTASSSGPYTIRAPSTDGRSLVDKKFAIADRDKNTSTSVRVYSGTAKNCGELAGLLSSSNASVKRFSAYLVTPGATYVDKRKSNDTSTGEVSTTSCSVEGIGWILCPVANALAGITDALFAGVAAFMKVQPLSFSTDDSLYTAWSVMRSIANIAFVIVFLVIIFSQLTSMGVSNYGVKKLLPRLIVGAILVNLSYFICALAVDVSNILGFGVQAAFSEVASLTANTGQVGNNWVSITTAVLAGAGTLAGTAIALTAITSMSIWAMLAVLLPLLVSALFALVIAFLVLLARQALIIMLIVISPLAFVAYLLPNTEELFKKWRKLFTSLLVLFPLLSVVFGGSMLASVILRESSVNGGGNEFISFCLYVGSFAVQAIPFFITPLLINLSQGVLGRFAGLVNNKNKGPFDRIRKGAERIGKDAQNRGYANKLKGPSNMFNSGARRRARVERISGSLDNVAKHNAGDYITEELGNKESNLAKRMAGGDEEMGKIIAAKAVAAGEAEELKEAMQPLNRAVAGMSVDDKNKYLEAQVAGGGIGAAAALHYSAAVGNDSFISKQFKKADTDNNPELRRQTQEAVNANAGAFLGKAPHFVKGPAAAFGSIKGSELAQYKPDTAQEAISHIQRLAAATRNPTASPEEITLAKGKYQTAVNGFNSAIQDIQNSPELQGQFSGEVGTRIKNILSSASTPIEIQQALAVGANSIQSDGKIRGAATPPPSTPGSNNPPPSGSGPNGFFLPGDSGGDIPHNRP